MCVYVSFFVSRRVQVSLCLCASMCISVFMCVSVSWGVVRNLRVTLMLRVTEREWDEGDRKRRIGEGRGGCAWSLREG